MMTNVLFNIKVFLILNINTNAIIHRHLIISGTYVILNKLITSTIFFAWSSLNKN